MGSQWIGARIQRSRLLVYPWHYRCYRQLLFGWSAHRLPSACWSSLRTRLPMDGLVSVSLVATGDASDCSLGRSPRSLSSDGVHHEYLPHFAGLHIWYSNIAATCTDLSSPLPMFSCYRSLRQSSCWPTSCSSANRESRGHSSSHRQEAGPVQWYLAAGLH